MCLCTSTTQLSWCYGSTGDICFDTAFLTSFLREGHSNAIYMYEIWIRENLITISAPKTVLIYTDDFD